MGRVVCWFLFVLLAGCSGDVVAPIAVDLAVVGVTVVDCRPGEVLPERTILVRDGRVVAVAESASAAPFTAVTTVDGAGHFAVPGLWDMHVHTDGDAGVLRAFLASGITGVRDLGGKPSLALAARDAVERGELVGPRLVVSGPQLDSRPDDGSGWRRQVTSESEAVAAVAALVDLAVDVVKVHDLMSADVHAVVGREAERVGLAVVGHQPRGVPIEQAARLQRTIEHATTWGERALTSAALESDMRFEDDLARFLAFDGRGGRGIAALVEYNTAFCPTLVAGEGLVRASDPQTVVWDDPRLAHSPLGTADEWRELLPVELLPPNFHSQRLLIERAARRIVGAMHARGVTLIAGSDSGAPHVYWGDALHDELALLVTCGLSSLEALRCATIRAVDVLGVSESLGAIAPGFEADFLLVDGNPLDDLGVLREPIVVVVRGRALRREDLVTR